eukprot:3711-Heterococcus_DN1.PRE.1
MSVFSRRLHPFGSSLTCTVQHTCVPSRQTGRVSSIGDGKRPDLLAPLMLTTGALDIDKSKQLHSTFLDSIDAAQGARALMVTSAERAWQTTVRGAETVHAHLCDFPQCGAGVTPYNVSARGVLETVEGVEQAPICSDGAAINVDSTVVNRPQTTVAEQAKWAATGRRIIFADAYSDCHRKEKDAGCVTFAYASAHGVANRLLLSTWTAEYFLIAMRSHSMASQSLDAAATECMCWSSQFKDDVSTELKS